MIQFCENRTCPGNADITLKESALCIPALSNVDMYWQQKNAFISVFGAIFLIFSLLNAVTFATQKKEADFLIVENPAIYTILNEYQQPLTDSEKDLIRPYSPLQIVQVRELLGDQITNAARFLLNNKTIFIPVNDKYQRISDRSTWEKTYKNCVIYNDTSIVARSLTLYVKTHGSSNSFTISKGAKIRRIFQFQSLWYVCTVGNDGQYGWYQGGTDVFLANQKHDLKTEPVSTSDVAERVHSRLLTANGNYTTLFEYFNRKTLQQKSIPHWTMVVDGPVIRCILNGSTLTAQYLEQSTRYITSDIEHILLGKPFYAVYQKGEIIISPRP